MSWNWFVNSIIPGALSPVLKNFAAFFPDPTDHPWVAELRYSWMKEIAQLTGFLE